MKRILNLLTMAAIIAVPFHALSMNIVVLHGNHTALTQQECTCIACQKENNINLATKVKIEQYKQEITKKYGPEGLTFIDNFLNYITKNNDKRLRMLWKKKPAGMTLDEIRETGDNMGNDYPLLPALHIAIGLGFLNIVTFLINECEANVNALDYRGHNALMLLTKILCTNYRLSPGDPLLIHANKIAELLIEQGININQQDIFYKGTALHYLVNCSNYNPQQSMPIIQLLLARKAHLNLQDIRWHTPLHQILDEKEDFNQSHLDLFNLLVEHGADIHMQCRCKNLQTPADHLQTYLKKEKKSVQEQCQSCKKIGAIKEPLLLCSGCKQIKYCSQDCQKKDWVNHKATCKSLLQQQQPAVPSTSTSTATNSIQAPIQDDFSDNPIMMAWKKNKKNQAVQQSRKKTKLDQTASNSSNHTEKIDNQLCNGMAQKPVIEDVQPVSNNTHKKHVPNKQLEESSLIKYYAQRTLCWFDKESTDPRVKNANARSMLYHSFPLLADTYIIKYGIQKPWNNKISGQVDTNYCLGGTVVYPDNTEEKVTWTICLDPQGVLYHRGPDSTFDEHFKESAWKSDFPVLSSDQQTHQEQLKAYNGKINKSDGSFIFYEDDAQVKIWDNKNQVTIILYKPSLNQ